MNISFIIFYFLSLIRCFCFFSFIVGFFNCSSCPNITCTCSPCPGKFSELLKCSINTFLLIIPKLSLLSIKGYRELEFFQIVSVLGSLQIVSHLSSSPAFEIFEDLAKLNLEEVFML